jgi:hypothetical protein
MSQTLRNIQKSRQGVQSNVVPFPAMLEQFKGEIAPRTAQALESGSHGAHRTDRVPHEPETGPDRSPQRLCGG